MPKKTGPKVTVTAQHRKFARALVRQGKSYSEAFEAAGYSPKQGLKGMQEVRRRPALRKAVDDEIRRFARESEGLPSAEIRARMLRHRLTLNVAQGVDRAVQSCKLLGADKEVGGLWSPASMGEYIIIEMPRALPTMEGVPVLEPEEVNSLPKE